VQGDGTAVCSVSLPDDDGDDEIGDYLVLLDIRVSQANQFRLAID
jgi:hypothetical protein